MRCWPNVCAPAMPETGPPRTRFAIGCWLPGSSSTTPRPALPGSCDPPSRSPDAATVRPRPDGLPLSPVTVAPNDFVHLHLHSEFSLLDGLGRINDLADQGSKLGFDAMAITDHGALYGAVAFVQAIAAKGIKPIVGVETYVARRSMRDKEGKADSQPFPPGPAGRELGGLSEPLPPRHRRAPRRLLLQAADRP